MNKRSDKKEHILTTGLEVMKTSGYNGTSVKDIVDAAGVPKGSFYNYFESKQAFVIAALEMVAAESYQAARQVLSATSMTPLQRIIRYFEAEADNASDSEYTTGCFIGNICQEMSDSCDVIRLKVRFIIRATNQLFEECLEEARVKGDLAKDTNTEYLAEFLFNSWEGSLMSMKAEKSRKPLDAFLKTLPILLSTEQ